MTSILDACASLGQELTCNETTETQTDLLFLVQLCIRPVEGKGHLHHCENQR